MKIKPAAQAADADLSLLNLPIGKIHPFSKFAITCEPVMQFRSPYRFLGFLLAHERILIKLINPAS